MKKINLIFFYGIFTIIVCGCSIINKKTDIKSTTGSEELITINIDTLQKEQSILASEIFGEIGIIPLETNTNCLIGHIDQVEIFDNLIYILDVLVSKSVFVFDQNGKFLRKIGRQGKGPGEFLRPDMFVLNNTQKTIYILDRNSKRILEYSLDGEFIMNFHLRGEYHSNQIAYNNGTIYIDNLPRKGQVGSYWLYSIDEDAQIVNRWFSFDEYNKGFNQPLSIASNFFQSEADVKYVKPFFDTIFSIKNSTIYPYIALTSKNEINDDDITKINSSRNASELVDNFRDLKKFHGISRYMENEKMIYFEFRNHRLYHRLFFNKQTKKIHCSTEIIDDFTNIFPMSKFLCSTHDGFVSVLQGSTLQEFKKNINENRIIGADRAINYINEESNPVLVVYKF